MYVRLSVCDVEVLSSYGLRFFESKYSIRVGLKSLSEFTRLELNLIYHTIIHTTTTT